MCEDHHYPELLYYVMDLGPIISCWVFGFALFFFFVALPFLLWCTVKCKRRGDDLLCTCKTCHCDYCGRLKCSDKGEKCSCKRCTENSTYKSCHSVPGCEKCIMTVPRYEGIGCEEKSTKICTKEHSKSCFCYCEFCKKIPNLTWQGSNLLIRILFGGSVGPLRESKKMSDTDHHGRDILYISDTPIPQNAVMLHLALTFKSIMLIVFCLSTFFDIFIVRTKYKCEDGFDCYIFDKNLNDYPIKNCAIVNKTICYKFVYDYKKAAGYVGGLYTVSRLALAFVANSCIIIYKKIRNRKVLRFILILIQYGIGFSFIATCLGLEYGKYIYLINDKPALSQVGDVFSSLGIVLTIALSVLTPWHLAVQTIDKVSPQTQNGALNIQQSESQALASNGEHIELDQANDYDIQRVTEKTHLVT